MPVRLLQSEVGVEDMEWTQWLPLLAGGIALLGIWGSIQHRLGKLEAQVEALKQGQAETRAENIRMYQEARAENIRLHEETRAEFRREIRLVLQAMREHTHADGSPASIPVPVDIDGD